MFFVNLYVFKCAWAPTARGFAWSGFFCIVCNAAEARTSIVGDTDLDLLIDDTMIEAMGGRSLPTDPDEGDSATDAPPTDSLAHARPAVRPIAASFPIGTVPTGQENVQRSKTMSEGWFPSSQSSSFGPDEPPSDGPEEYFPPARGGRHASVAKKPIPAVLTFIHTALHAAQEAVKMDNAGQFVEAAEMYRSCISFLQVSLGMRLC